MTRTWKESFDQHLTFQAGIAFGAELAFFHDLEEWAPGATVVDVGCGNGAYLERLAAAFPDMTFVGVDTDAELIELAEARRTSPNVEFRLGHVEDLDEHFTILVSRFCLLYSSGTPTIAEWAGRRGVNLIIEIDNDDRIRELGPALRRTESRMTVAKRNKADGYFRTCENTTAEHWIRAGYEHLAARELTVTSEAPFSRSDLYHWLVSITELEAGSPLPSELADELYTWYLGSGRVYLGFRASYFRLSS